MIRTTADELDEGFWPPATKRKNNKTDYLLDEMKRMKERVSQLEEQERGSMAYIRACERTFHYIDKLLKEFYDNKVEIVGYLTSYADHLDRHRQSSVNIKAFIKKLGRNDDSEW